jgi:predicted nucleotidyltransferase
MEYQGHRNRQEYFLNFLLTNAIGLAYFFGSQKELGLRLLAGETLSGTSESDLDLGVVLLEHPLDYWEGQRLRRHLEEGLAPLFAPIRLHLLLLEEENAHVQYAAIRGIQAYAVSEEFARQYRGRVLTLYGDWHSWWP